MRRRQVLALSITGLVGCIGSNDQVNGPTTTTLSTTTTTTTTREPCSTDIDIEASPEKPSDLAKSAQQLARTIESEISREHFDPDGYFNFMLTEQSSEKTEEGVTFRGRVEVDYSSSGDGENATTVHAHLFYDVTYRLTDQRVVRAKSEEGPTGTVVCW